ncbi:hypothetical protein [Geothrix sp. PMB-07]|uniref:hypothetical protein n=1 Tax=Geothrix sp. PMB-07 TaxID=3068640 RepID=UPI0027409042|nr:hypothetical protein [Geothrix sp. PMB-07]WLT30417.1 hypothetical protein Q9293_11875 [Geothrix sp. PMB-07]
MWDFLAAILEIATAATPIRVFVALIPTLLIASLVYWAVPDKSTGAWLFGVIFVVGISLGFWWHFRELKYDRQA